ALSCGRAQRRDRRLKAGRLCVCRFPSPHCRRWVSRRRLKRRGSCKGGFWGGGAGLRGGGVSGWGSGGAMRKITCVVVCAALAVCVAPRMRAQQSNWLTAPQGWGSGTPQGNGDFWLSAPLELRVVKGMPYSAEIVTESIQTLSDGNRIVQRSTSRVYR